MPQCQEFERAQLAGRLEAPESLAHFRRCEHCSFEFNHLKKLAGLLRDLGHGDSDAHAASAELWTTLVARLDAPRRRDTLPLPFAGVSRLAGALAKPAVAAAWATGIAGVLVGLWLGHASSGLESTASYAESNLIEESETGVAATFATSFDDPIEDIDSTQSP